MYCTRTVEYSVQCTAYIKVGRFCVCFFPNCYGCVHTYCVTFVHTANGQTHPSPPSRHPSLLLAANLSPPHPAVIFHPSCWRSSSPLPPSIGVSRVKRGGDEEGRRERGDRRKETGDGRREAGDVGRDYKGTSSNVGNS